jgi:hypothetical protein
MGALQALCPKTMYSDSKEWYLDAYVSRVSGDGKGNFQIPRKASVVAEDDERRFINRIPTGNWLGFSGGADVELKLPPSDYAVVLG